jgi:AsmA protein
MDWPRRWLARLGTLGLALIVVVALVIVGFFASLPEIVRQVVMRQVPKAIGRQITIEDIDLNLFTGNLAIKKLRLSERTGPQAFVEFERLEVRLALLSLVRQNIHLRDLRLVAPAVRVVRGADGKLNFDDLMPAVQERPLAREPTKWSFTLDHAAIEGGRVVVEDRAVSPAAEWSI